MRMHNPPHPGEIIRTLCLEPLGLTVTQAAAALGVSRKTLSAILNGRAGVSPEMAVRLSRPLARPRRVGSTSKRSTTSGTLGSAERSFGLRSLRRRRCEPTTPSAEPLPRMRSLQPSSRVFGGSRRNTRRLSETEPDDGHH
jgi:antitoxin HigA-1